MEIGNPLLVSFLSLEKEDDCVSYKGVRGGHLSTVSSLELEASSAHRFSLQMAYYSTQQNLWIDAQNHNILRFISFNYNRQNIYYVFIHNQSLIWSSRGKSVILISQVRHLKNLSLSLSEEL